MTESSSEISGLNLSDITPDSLNLLTLNIVCSQEDRMVAEAALTVSHSLLFLPGSVPR